MSWRWFDALWRDLLYALRQLRRAPGFAGTIVGTVGLGTVIFTAINSTVLHPIAGEKADRDVLIHETHLPQRPQMQLSPPTFLDLQQRVQSLESISAWASITAHLERTRKRPRFAVRR